MVGFTPRESVRLSQTEYAIAGAVSGSITRAICQPLDVLKIRFQLQIEPIAKGPNSKYSGLFQATGSILREEGWQAFWKGHVPAQMLSIVYGMAQYMSFEVLTQTAWHVLPKQLTTTEWRPVTHTVCGAASGSIATCIIHPMDVLRTRFIGQGEPKMYTGIVDAGQKILSQEGVLGFYRGLIPAIIQIAPQMGLQFGFYSLFTGLWNRTRGVWFDSIPDSVESFVCGTGSGMVSKSIIFPLDVVKKRLQVQGFESARIRFGATRQYSGMVSCLVQIARQEGVRGLYKGLTPGVLKAGLVAGINFSVYEQTCRKWLALKKAQGQVNRADLHHAGNQLTRCCKPRALKSSLSTSSRSRSSGMSRKTTFGSDVWSGVFFSTQQILPLVLNRLCPRLRSVSRCEAFFSVEGSDHRLRIRSCSLTLSLVVFVLT
ncbi:mitochondrial thiamine pyrophosphate carrier-like [Babylonia areolata]|uniref:mitochondrial thiamine pyrophosphate carrier-like n=1 Tax=Babylonia areolata TaxID=304850 RepID=UPI003FD64D59